MYDEIVGIEANRPLNTSVDDLVAYFVEKYTIEAPQLNEDNISVDQKETKIDVSGDPSRSFRNTGLPIFVPGTQITFFVPFTGDRDLFYGHPSSVMTYSPPRALVGKNELEISYKVTDHDAQAIKAQVESTLSEIKRLLVGTHNDVRVFNQGLRQRAEGKIKARGEKLLKDSGMAAELGFPLRKRENAPTTYAVPMTLKKVIPQLPPASTAPFKPEPTLEWGEYENILSIISNMVEVIERSPSTFTEIKEEDLRQHFLVQLNGQYKGQATGETFNAHGKTDILIRVEGKNIFIAECKFWKGEGYLVEAINQLLGYTAWRDSKTAILIFNRNKNLSGVLAQIPEMFKRHPNFKRQIEYLAETGFRFVFHHNDDKNREIFITVLVFEMPL